MSLWRRTRRGLSALTPVFASAGVLAVGACSLVENDTCCWVEVRPRHGGPTDSLAAYNSSLLDSAGLAGIEIGVLGRVFAADDFKPTAQGWATEHQRLPVTEHGAPSVWVRLGQGGREAAAGTMSWTLRRNTNWGLMVDRTDQPPWVYFLGDYYEDKCSLEVHLCRYKRLPISEDLANYPGESLWLVLAEFPAKVPKGAIP